MSYFTLEGLQPSHNEAVSNTAAKPKSELSYAERHASGDAVVSPEGREFVPIVQSVWPEVPMALKERLAAPISIGKKTARGRLWLAPMAGLGHVPLRSLIDDFGGCGLLFTGMCNARAVPSERRMTYSAFSWSDAERDHCVMQLFGNEPEYMAESAKRIEAEGFFGVDINMGCSVTAFTRKGYGAELLRQPDLAVSLVESIRKAVDIPVFVKFRTGWSTDPTAAIHLAKRFENAGADALVFHPRVAPDRRTRPPFRSHIKLVKDAVSIPVIGNGSVVTADSALHMLDSTGCDGISLGRLAVSRPWIFTAWTGLLNEDPSVNPRLWQDTAEKMLDAIIASGGDKHYMARQYGRFMLYYIANFVYGAKLRGPLTTGLDIDILRASTREIFRELPLVALTPTAAMF